MAERLVIIGGDAAGMTAAAQARRRSSPADLDIVVFERGEFTSYSACGLPYLVGGLVAEADELVARSPAEHRTNGIDVRTGHEVVEVNIDSRAVTIHRLADGQTIVEQFDDLMFATGAIPTRPDLPGINATGIHGIQTITDGISLRAHVQSTKCRNAVVVGGGYIGLEMAEAMKRSGLNVTLVNRSAQPMNTMDPDMGELIAAAITGMGVEIYGGVEVAGFETDHDGNVVAVATKDHEFPADVVVLGLGVTPNSALARQAGVLIGPSRGIAADRKMATNVEGVWTAGDCAESFHRITGKPVAIALGTHANKQGKVVGVNATGGYAAFPGVIGTAVTSVCDLEIARTGLSEKEARRNGFDFITGRIESTTRAGYYPGAEAIHVKVLADANTGRLLGAQIVGKEGAAKRIDVLATAIWAGMTADEFAELDLGYAPPFSPVWDPTLIAARKIVAHLDGR